MVEPRGRGRLSTIDMLPEWADAVKLWAFAELTARRRTQQDILREFNARLARAAKENGVKPAPQIKSSAFNRTAMRKAELARNIEQTTAVMRAMAQSVAAGDSDELTKTLGELLKVRTFEALELLGEGGASTKQIMEAARALQATVLSLARSSEHRKALQQESYDKTKQVIDAVADGAAKEGKAIDRAALLKRIREDIYGIVAP